MAPAILITALVALPIVVSTCIAYAGYATYKRRHHLPHDIERVRNSERTRQHDERSVQLQDFEQHEKTHDNVQAAYVGVVPANVAPAAKPLPCPYVETTGGEGLVYSPTRYTPPKYQQSNVMERVFNDEGFEEVELNGTPPWDYERAQLQQTALFRESGAVSVVAPRPMRVAATISNDQHANSLYSVKEMQVGDAWERIKNQEPLGGYIRKNIHHKSTMHDENEEEKWEDEDLGHGSEECGQPKRPATPVPQSLSRQLSKYRFSGSAIDRTSPGPPNRASHASSNSSRPLSSGAPRSSYASNNDTRISSDAPQKFIHASKNSSRTGQDSPRSSTSNNSNRSGSEQPQGKASILTKASKKYIQGRISLENTRTLIAEDLYKTSLEHAAAGMAPQRNSAGPRHSWEQSQRNSMGSQRSREERKEQESRELEYLGEAKRAPEDKEEDGQRRIEETRKQEIRKSKMLLTGYASSDDEA